MNNLEGERRRRRRRDWQFLLPSSILPPIPPPPPRGGNEENIQTPSNSGGGREAGITLEEKSLGWGRVREGSKPGKSALTLDRIGQSWRRETVEKRGPFARSTYIKCLHNCAILAKHISFLRSPFLFRRATRRVAREKSLSFPIFSLFFLGVLGVDPPSPSLRPGRRRRRLRPRASTAFLVAPLPPPRRR